MALLTVGLLALVAGGALWTVMGHRDAAGAFSGAVERVETPGYAIVVPDLDALLRRDAALARTAHARIRVAVDGSRGPAFLGLAPADAVDGYLTGQPYARVDGLAVARGPLPVRLTQIVGSVDTPSTDDRSPTATTDGRSPTPGSDDSTSQERSPDATSDNRPPGGYDDRSLGASSIDRAPGLPAAHHTSAVPAAGGVAGGPVADRFVSSSRRVAVASGPLALTSPAVPGGQSFWIRQGEGWLDVNPADLTDQRLSLVVMRADARPGVAADLRVEARAGWLDPVAWGLIAGGLLLVGLAAVLLIRPRLPREVVFVVEPRQVPTLAARLGVIALDDIGRVPPRRRWRFAPAVPAPAVSAAASAPAVPAPPPTKPTPTKPIAPVPGPPPTKPARPVPTPPPNRPVPVGPGNGPSSTRADQPTSADQPTPASQPTPAAQPAPKRPRQAQPDDDRPELPQPTDSRGGSVG
ncbi:hypothetical protein [Micromonospora zhanjiangensis]|uniref:Capsular polysaccharide biosynthesis protein n=1 Tax=Micromonospora zhanjiangensis TaxID=1522057 RepID=A0ABV8KNV6_9ACTN